MSADRIRPARSGDPATGERAAGGRLGIPRTLLVASGPLGSLGAPAAAAAIGEGLWLGGWEQLDLCPLDADPTAPARLQLEAVGLPARLRRSRAVLIASQRLTPHDLLGSVAFEIATQARQGGVPAYALAVEDSLGAFPARMLDLQVVMQVSAGERALTRAGRELAGLL